MCLVAGMLIAVVIDGGRLSWNSRPFSSDDGLLSAIFLLLAAFTFLYGYRSPEWDGLSPLRLFYTAWFALLALGCLRLTTAEPPFTVRFWVAVACGLSGFYLGARWARTRRGEKHRIALEKLKEHWTVDWRPSRALFTLAALFLICLVAFGYEYWRAGMLPLLADDPNWARFNFGLNSYLHRFAISFYLLIFLGYIGVVHVRRYRVAFLIMALLSFLAITLLTARVFLVSAVWMAIVMFHYGRRRLTPKLVLCTVLIAYPVAKLAVDVKRFYEDPTFNKILDKIDFPEKLRVVGPDYMYFSSTLQTLDNLTHLVPDELSYNHGWYVGYPVRVFWTPREGEGFRGRLDDLFWERSKDWSPFPSVTTTYIGWPYADFGIPGVLIFSCLFGWLSVRVYELMRAQPTFWRVFLYSQFSFGIVLSIYSSYFSLFDVYWNVVIIGAINRFVSDRSRFVAQTVPAKPALSF